MTRDRRESNNGTAIIIVIIINNHNECDVVKKAQLHSKKHYYYLNQYEYDDVCPITHSVGFYNDQTFILYRSIHCLPTSLFIEGSITRIRTQRHRRCQSEMCT